MLSNAGVATAEASARIARMPVKGGLSMSMYSGNGITGEGV